MRNRLPFYEDSKKEYFLKAEKNITLYPGFRAVGVMMNGEKNCFRVGGEY